ncbi:MAG TPA: hypothetical protein VK773_00380 [Acidimicrobiales bacterium]|nr:hypothetical protein [Acidimicrobiales bacterium]
MSAAASAVSGLVLAALVLPAVLPAAASSKHATTTTHHSSAPKLDALGHLKFWECPTKTTQMLVTVNTLTLHPGSTLDITFIVKNTGSSSCNYTAPYAGVAPGPTSTTLQAGPCGSIGFEIATSRGHQVWPGPELVNCPALGFAQLAPGATVTGTGTWNQDVPNTDRRVSPGKYTLIVDNKTFKFPIRVSSS